MGTTKRLRHVPRNDYPNNSRSFRKEKTYTEICFYPLTSKVPGCTSNATLSLERIIDGSPFEKHANPFQNKKNSEGILHEETYLVGREIQKKLSRNLRPVFRHYSTARSDSWFLYLCILVNDPQMGIDHVRWSGGGCDSNGFSPQSS